MKEKNRLEVHIHPVGMIALAAAFLFLPSHEVLAAVLALLWHEGAHVLTMLCCKCKCRIELTPFGGMADAADFKRLRPLKQALIAASGVAASTAGAWGCAILLPHHPFPASLVQYHLSLAFVNCIPAWPLDGARVLMAMAAAFGKEHGMRRCLSVFSYVFGLCMVSAGLYGAWNGHTNLSLLLAGPYLWYASGAGTVSDRLRHVRHCCRKLEDGALLPVDVVASAEKDVRPLFPVLIGKWPQNRYHFLIQLDSEGNVHRIWSEKQILSSSLEGIDRSKK